MRVISGKYKGKKLEGFGIPGTRPTMDRLKESLFGTIQTKVKNSIVLDLFAGSGSLGIESLSNGASECYFVESGKEISKYLKRNLVNLKNAKLFLMDYKVALSHFQKEKVKFDIVFLDPPYHALLLNEAIQQLDELHLLNDNCFLVCECEEEYPVLDLEKYSLIKEKNYGEKTIFIYEYNGIDIDKSKEHLF